MFKKISYWGGVVVWCGLIFYLSSVPNLKTDLGTWDLILRKGAHIVEYGVLFLLIFGAVSNSWSWRVKTIYWIAIIFAVLYAISDEYHQGFVPGRGPSVIDVGIDSVGVVFFSLVHKYKISKYRNI